MKTITRVEIFDDAPANKVFKTIDDLGITGMHMTQSNGMMLGSKLYLEFLTKNHTGLGSMYRWTGKILGLKMDFTVEVTKWIESKEKAWETIGQAKLIILSWYRMHLEVHEIAGITEAELSITYEKPKSVFKNILSFLFADLYCKWCLKKMLGDAKKSLKESLQNINEPIESNFFHK